VTNIISSKYLYKILILLFLLMISGSTYGFICGDADNNNEGPNVADLVYLVDYLFKGGTAPEILESSSVDGEPGILVSDLTYMVDFLFKGGDAPVCDSIPDPTTEVTLFAPIGLKITYLIDDTGHVVNTWTSNYRPALSVYLLDDNSLLRTANLGGNGTFMGTGGSGGRVERYDWSGNLIWEFEYSTNNHLLHHDIEPLPNGNVLMISWEHKSASEAIDAGRNSALLTNNQLWPEKIIEVEPSGSSGGTIVWEWCLWDNSGLRSGKE
jgi:arylsulfotransferase ASST